MVGSSTAEEGVALNQSQRPEEGVEGSLAGPLSHHPWAAAAVEEEGCPLQVEEEGSWLAGVAGGEQILRNPLQPKEVAEEGGLGLEVVGGGSRQEVEVEVGHFQCPEKQVLVWAWERDRWPGLVIWL